MFKPTLTLVALVFVLLGAATFEAATRQPAPPIPITVQQGAKILATIALPLDSTGTLAYRDSLIASRGAVAARDATIAAQSTTIAALRDTVNRWRPAPPPPPAPAPAPPPPPAPAPTPPPAGYTVLSDERWLTKPPAPTGSGVKGVWSLARTTDTANVDPVAPPAGWPVGTAKVLQLRFPLGHPGGTAPNYVFYNLTAGVRDLVATFGFQAAPGWQGVNGQTKMFWIARATDGGSGFFLQTKNPKTAGTLGQCFLSLNSQGLPGSNRIYGANGVNPDICDGAVHTIRVHVVANTVGDQANVPNANSWQTITPGDGIVDVQVDGKPVLAYTNAVFFGPGWPGARVFDRIRFETTYGGGTLPAPAAMAWYIGPLTVLGR